MSFQPLDGGVVIDPFVVASFTGPDNHTGIYLDVDQINSSLLIQTNDTNAFYVDRFQNVGINNVSPSAQLDVNSATGGCLQLTYNGSANHANLNVASDGKLLLAGSGSEVTINASNDFNVKSHNGTTAGLRLNNTLVIASADQINYNVVTPGVTSATKALVVDANRDLNNLRNLTADSFIGTLQTAAQPNIESVTILDVTSHDGTTAGLSLGGVLIEATASHLNTTSVTAGTAAANKALVLNADRDISNIRNLSAVQLTGQLQTAAQPNITSVGTLTSLDLSGSLTGLTELGINTTTTGRTLVLNSAAGNCLQLLYDNGSGVPTNFVDMLVSSGGNLSITPSGGNLDITSHDGATVGLMLGGVLLTATADQINYLQGTTPGTVVGGKALILDANRNIGNIHNLTADNLTGTIQTAAQPNISSVNVLNVANHNGTTLGLSLNGELVTSMAPELNYVDTTPGTVEASKAMVVDADRSITNIHDITADNFIGTTFTGTLQTAAQPNIASVNVLDVTTHDGATVGLSLGGVLITATAQQINEIVSGTGNSAFADITVADTVTITNANGTDSGLILGSTLITSTGEELNRVDTTAGTVEASKAMVVDANRDITNIHSLTAEQLTGQVQTAAQPLITSVGELTSLDIAGELTVGDVTLSDVELSALDSVVPGTASAERALVLDADSDIEGIHNLSLTNELTVGATIINETDIAKLDGITNGTATADKALVLDADRSITNINSLTATTLTGTQQTAAQPNITTVGTLTNIATSGTLTMGATVINEAEIGLIDGITAGTVAASKALVADANKNISGLNALSTATGNFIDTTDSTTTGTGAIITAGGVGIAKRLNVGGATAINSTTASTSSTTGALIVSGGTGVGGALNVGGVTSIASTVASTSTTTGALVVSGGTGIGGALNVNTSAIIKGTGLTAVNSSVAGTDWVSRTTPNFQWKAIGYSSTLNMFVAASTNGQVMTSSDNGVTWTQRTGVSGNWRSVMWSVDKGLFVVVGETAGTPVMTSPDGITWTARTAPGSLWQDVCYAPSLGYFVAVGTGGNPFVMTSFDAITWTARTAPNADGWYSVCWSPENAMFVAVSVSGTFMTSLNGSTWTRNTAPIGSMYSVCWSPEKAMFVAVANAGTNRAMTSTDGTTWTSRNMPEANTWWSVVWAASAGIFVAVSWDGTNRAATSTDGITWTARSLPNNQWIDICWASSISTLACVAFGGGSAVATSSNSAGSSGLALDVTGKAGVTGALNVGGVTSVTATTAATGTTSGALVVSGGMGVAGAAYIGGNAVVSSTTASTNASSGALTVSGGTGIIGALNVAGATTVTNATASTSTASGALIVTGGAGIGGATYIGGATNITNTTTSTSTTTGALIVSGGTGIGGALNVGGASKVMDVTDSTSITTGAMTVAGGAGVSKSLYVGSATYINGSNLAIATATAGTDWTLRTTAEQNQWADVCWSPELSLFVATAVSGTNRVMTSPDSITWTARSASDNNGTWNGVCWAASLGLFVAVATGGTSQRVMTSPNGTTWTGRSVPQQNDWQQVCWSPQLSLFVAVCTSGTNQIMTSPDGITWTVRTNTATGGFRGICWSPQLSLFVAVAAWGTNNDLVMTSSNGITWTTRQAASAAQWTGICWSPELSLFVSTATGGGGASNNLVMTSPDGINWTLRQASSGGAWFSVCWSPTYNLFVSTSFTGAGYLMTSPNGITWTGRPIPQYNSWQKVIWASGINMFVTTSYDGTNRVMTSTTVSSGSRSALVVTGKTDISDALTIGGISSISNTTESTTISNGSLYTAGGVGIAKALRVGGGIYGTLQTAAQPTITSVGTLTGLSVAGNVTVGATTINESEIAVIDSATAGTAVASKALVVDADRSITNIHYLTADQLTGTLQTVAQPNITTVGTLTDLSVAGTVTVGATTFTETELGVLDAITNGAAAANKAMVMDTNRDIANIHNITADNFIGVLQTAAQPNITSVGVLTELSVAGSLIVGGTIITEGEMARLDDITEGTAEADKALVVDENRDIVNIRNLAAAKLTGEMQTAAQPLITSLGTLTSVTTSGSVTVGDTIISEDDIVKIDGITAGIATEDKALVVDIDRNIRNINYLTAVQLTGEIQTAAQPNITSVGTLTSVTTSGDVTVGATVISETDIAKIDGITNGTAAADKALVVNATRDIANINDITAVNYYGLLQTAAQPNITSVGILDNLAVAGDFTLGDTTINEASLAQLGSNTPGTAIENKALVVDGNRDIVNIHYLTADQLTGTLQTAAQPNVTSVGTLTSVTTSGDLTLGATVISETDIAKLDAITNGTAGADKALVLDAASDITGIHNLTADNLFASQLTGEIQTAAQPLITSVGTLTSVTTSGDLTLGATVISETDIGKLDAITNGTASANKALVIDGNRDITNIHYLTADQLTGQLQTAAQPNVTSVGTLTSLVIAGGLTLGATTVNETDILQIGGATPGTAIADKVLVVDADRSISNINILTATDVIATTLTGELQTAAQPLITSVGTLTTLAVAGDVTVGAIVLSETDVAKLDGITNGTASANKALVVDANRSITNINSLTATTITGEIQTASQPLITSVTTLDITGHDGGAAGLAFGGVLITATATELNYTDVTAGAGTASKAMVLDANKDITGVHDFHTEFLTAGEITGTLQTAAQPLITSVGTLTSVTTSGDVTVGATVISEEDIAKIDGITNGVGAAGKALVLSADRDIENIRSLTASTLTGTIQTAAQPLITSVGTLTSVTTSGDLTLGATVISESDIGKLDAITNGTASASKALVVDADKSIAGLNTASMQYLLCGNPANSGEIPLEIGYTTYQCTTAYAYGNEANAHGIVDAGNGPAANYSLRADGRILVTGEIEVTSDRRLKENIKNLNIHFAKEFVYKTTPVRYNYKSDGVVDYGYIAQDVLKAGFEDLVGTAPHKGLEGIEDDDGFISPQDTKFTLSTGKMIPLLALNQRQIFDKLAKKDEQINDLEARLAKLEEIISNIM